MYSHVFFDLDGTLTDSRPGIIHSVQYALRHFGMEMPEAALLPFIGPPLLYSFQQFCGMDARQVAEAVTRYREYFKDRGIYENSLYPGVTELLRALRAAHRRVALATSKPEVFAHRIVAYFGMEDCFDCVCGAGLDGPRQSKADVLAYACATLEARDMRRCVLVGDRIYDVQGAEALGMDCIGVLYGYGAPGEFCSPAVVRQCSSVRELRQTLLPEMTAG